MVTDEALADLWDAADAEQLWRVLVTRPHGGDLAPSAAVELFERHHVQGEPGAVDSALLLCTDWRWRRSSAKVLAGILDIRVLDDAEQDELADQLLWPDQIRYLHPVGWFGTTFVEFDIGDARRRRTVHVDPATTMEARRNIWPPLRRWAANRMLTRRLAEPSAVIKRARSLPPQDGAAVITGAVLAADHLTDPQARLVVDVALGWGHKSARKAALERLRSCGQGERARALAAADPDASLRRWADDDRGRAQPGLFA